MSAAVADDRGAAPCRDALTPRLRDAPVGGQAVLEGVMMRGVSTWAVAVRKPPPRAADGPARPEQAALGEIDVESFPLVSWTRSAARLPLAGDPRRGRARRVAEDRLQGAGHLGQRAAARGGGGDLRRDLGGHRGRRRWCFAIGPVLRRAGRAHEPDQGPARLVAAVLAGRGRAAHRDLPRLPAAALAPAGPAARVRVPRRRAQGDLLLRGRGRALRPRTRPALLAAAPALRHELPADRDDRGDLRVRPDRAARPGTGWS